MPDHRDEPPDGDLWNRLPLALYLTSPEGTILDVNQEFVRLLGYADRESLLGTSASALYADPFGRERWKAALEAEETLPGWDTLLRRPDGSVFAARETARVLKSPGRTEFLGMVEDVTEAKRMEGALKQSEERFRRFFELGLIGMAITSPSKGFLEVNEQLCQILGYERSELGGMTWAEITHPDDLGADAALFERVLSGELEQYSIEKRFIRKDGLPVHTVISVQCARRGDKTVDYFVSLLRDISDRKRAEGEQALLMGVAERSAESVVITNRDGAIVYVNPAFERVSGYSRGEALGQNPRFLKSGHQDPAFYRRMWDTLLRGEVWSGTLVNRRKDGTLFQEHATIGPVHDASGQLTNYVAVKRDTSREASLERQLMQSQKMEAVGRLAGGVAHDFNNILGVITGYGEITLKQLGSQDPLRKKVEQILLAAERAAGLTRQLLAFSRHQVLEPRIVDLNVIVSEMNPMLERLIGEQIGIVTLLEGELGKVKADPGQIEQVLMNLVVNARDAMPGGGRITIETHNTDLGVDRTEHPGPHVMLAITDTGVGMDAETQSQIFEPFFTTKERGQGTGLGLSSVYGIVKQSQGHISVYSEVGVGTTFKVYLPRIDGEVQRTSRTVDMTLARGHETVLLIEDEVSLRDVLSETLEDGGYTVLVAPGGPAALEISAEYDGPIHVIVTDVIMPRMAGHEVVLALKPGRPEAKVLYISGYTEAVVNRSVFADGAAFLSKPFGPATLLAKMREVLDAR